MLILIIGSSCSKIIFGICKQNPKHEGKTRPFCYPNPTQRMALKPENPDTWMKNLQILLPKPEPEKWYLTRTHHYWKTKQKNVTSIIYMPLYCPPTNHAWLGMPCFVKIVGAWYPFDLLFFSKFIQFFKEWISSRTLLKI